MAASFLEGNLGFNFKQGRDLLFRTECVTTKTNINNE